MANMVRTARGNLVDMNQLFMDNQKGIALGNASLNARGDKVKNGKVVKTVEERRAEYEQSNERVTKTVSVGVDSKKIEEILKKDVEELTSMTPVKKTEPKVSEEKVSEGFSINDILNNN